MSELVQTYGIWVLAGLVLIAAIFALRRGKSRGTGKNIYSKYFGNQNGSTNRSTLRQGRSSC